MKLEDTIQKFEGSLMILRMDKNGWVVGFSVHPDEAPDLMMQARLGTRYQIVAVQIGDDENPTLPETEGASYVAKAGQLCRNESFQDRFIGDMAKPHHLMADYKPEELCAQLLREELEIPSRSALATNKRARNRLDEIIKEWKGDMEIDI